MSSYSIKLSSLSSLFNINLYLKPCPHTSTMKSEWLASQYSFMTVIIIYTTQWPSTLISQLYQVRITPSSISIFHCWTLLSLFLPCLFFTPGFFVPVYSYCLFHKCKFSPLTERTAVCFGYKGRGGNSVSIDIGKPRPSDSDGGRVTHCHICFVTHTKQLSLWLHTIVSSTQNQKAALPFILSRLQLLLWHMKDFRLTPLSKYVLSQKNRKVPHTDIKLQCIRQPLFSSYWGESCYQVVRKRHQHVVSIFISLLIMLQ